MNGYDYALGALSILLLAIVIVVVAAHYVGAYHEKRSNFKTMSKANDVFMKALGTAAGVAVILAIVGTIYFVRLCNVAA